MKKGAHGISIFQLFSNNRAPLVGASGKKNFDAGGEIGWKATVLN